MPEMYSYPKELVRHSIQASKGDLPSLLREAADWISDQVKDEEQIYSIEVIDPGEGRYPYLVVNMIKE